MEYRIKIKKDLPKFPDGVIDEWLVQFAKTEGWPPKTDLTGRICVRWQGILRGKSLNYWKNLDWRKEKIAVTPFDLVPGDREMITSLVLANVKNEVNIYSLTMPDSKERFDQICSYMREEGSFPKIVALERVNDKYKLIDGCHRLTAYFYLCGYYKVGGEDRPCLNVATEQEYWIAEQSAALDFLSDRDHVLFR